jgi:hypothetical protein
MVSSLTADPIATSRRLLISTSADARWTGVDVSDAGDHVLTTGRWPFLMQPVEGRLVLRGASGFTVHGLTADGTRNGTIAVESMGAGSVVPLTRAQGVMHYEVVRP